MSRNFIKYAATLKEAGQLSFTSDSSDMPTAKIPIYKDFPNWKTISVQIDSGAGVELTAYTSANINLTPNANAVAATGGDGTTAVTLTGGATPAMTVIQKNDGLGGVSNIAGVLGFVADAAPAAATQVTVLVQ